MKTRIAFGITLVAMLLGAPFVALLYAAQSPVAAAKHVDDEIIVRYRDGVDEYKKELGRFRLAGQRKKQFKTIPGLEVIKLGRNATVEEAIEALSQDPDVLYAEPNHILHLTAAPKITATPNDPSYGSLWGLTKIAAPTAWNITTGSNQVYVVVIDTGIDYTHPDLVANMGVDADGNRGLNVAYGNNDPMDDHYHGTHVAGTIGAVGNNGLGVVGVNWTVKLLACKFFDANGSATTEGAIECLDYVKDQKARGINIIATNNSWGGPENSLSLRDAVDEQRQAGILFISGAGNGNAFGIGQNNDTTPFYPCNYFLANIICVAATTSNDSKAGFSNYGRRTVHVGAPGQAILSTVPGGSYANLDGTSMATPHVAGLAALLKAQDMTRDWRVIKNLILAGGNTISSMSNTVTGKRINANGAMTCSTNTVASRVQPVASTISASPGVPVNLAYLNIRCATPNGSVNVTISSGGSVTLLDDGLGADQAAGDGIYSANWTPATTGTFTLTFPGNDRITVNVANPTINVTPSSLDFGGVSIGNSADKNFTVTNSGGGILSGSASTTAPYSIVSGGTYSLSAGQSQTVTVRFSPTTLGTFASSVTFTGAAGTTRTVTGAANEVSSITPSTIDLAAPPASFILAGNGFTNFGFGLPVANFTRNGTVIAQARATSGTGTSLTVPFPTSSTAIFPPLPGLSEGPVVVQVYNQTGTNNWSLVGSVGLTVNNTPTPPSVSSITPSTIDLASPPVSFNVVGTGFSNTGFGLPVANFYLNNTLVAQARATSGTNTSLTFPYPTNATSLGGSLPGLSAGTVTVQVYNQTSSNSWSLVGSVPLTVNDTRPAAGVSSITPTTIDLASPPASFTIAGNGFANFGYGLPVANFTRNGTVIAQARATSGTSTNLTVPFPTDATAVFPPLPGLSAGPVTVEVYNQTGANGWSLLGSVSLTVNDTRPPPGVSSITPSTIDLASPPASFTIAGNGFANFGYGLPVANFVLNGSVIAQARATSGNNTSLTVPFPTNATAVFPPLPGLSAGLVTVQIYNQTGSNGWTLVGSVSLTVNDTR